MELEKLTREYLILTQSQINIDLYNFYQISHHSTAIEGNTLTEIETEVFLEKGLTANGKPLEHHLMAKDHFNAIKFIAESAKSQQKITIDFIQEIAAKVMANTGQKFNTALGSFDSSNGDLRLLNVRAGMQGESFMDYKKVESNLKELCVDLNHKIKTVKSVTEINDLAYMAHYQLVTIHPFADGNGRTARLLMNYIQLYHNLPMSVIRVENKIKYIESLVATRKEEDISHFLRFMRTEHLAFLKSEIEKLTPRNPVLKNNNIRLLF